MKQKNKSKSKKNTPKKKTARSRKTNPALDPKYTPKVRREYLDMDYLDQLNEKEKAWLNKFMEEDLNASFKNTNSDLHKSKKAKREIYNKNNARNRDTFGVTKANNLLDYRENFSESEFVTENFEDELIDYIDKKRENGED